MKDTPAARTRLLVAALVAGVLAAGLPALWVVRADGPPVAAVVIALLGLLPAALALLVRPAGDR